MVANATAKAVNTTSSNKNDNSFAKKNPYSDFSKFEKKVEEMKPLAPDPNSVKMMAKIKQEIG